MACGKKIGLQSLEMSSDLALGSSELADGSSELADESSELPMSEL